MEPEARANGAVPLPDAPAGLFARFAARLPGARLLRNYAAIIAGNGISSLLSLAIFMLLARTMSVAGLGRFTIFFTVMVLVWQVPAFLDSAFVRYARTATPSESVDYLRALLILKAGAVFILVLLAVPLGLLLERWVFRGKIASSTLILAVAGGAFLALLTSIMAYCQSREKFVAYALGTVSFYALSLLVLGGRSVRGGEMDARTVTLVFFASAVLVGAAGYIVLAARARPLFPLPGGAARQMLRLGRWIFLTGLVYVAIQRIDVMVVGHFFDIDRVGVYSTASRLLTTLTIFLSAASSLYLPRASAAAASSRDLRAYIREAAVLTLFLTAVLAGLVIAAPLLLTLFFGAGFSAAVPAARLLFIGHAPLVLALPLSYFLYGLEDAAANFRGYLLCLVVNLAVNVALTPRLGITGPGLAFGAGYAAFLLYAAGAVYAHRARWRPLLAMDHGPKP